MHDILQLKLRALNWVTLLICTLRRTETHSPPDFILRIINVYYYYNLWYFSYTRNRMNQLGTRRSTDDSTGKRSREMTNFTLFEKLSSRKKAKGQEKQSESFFRPVPNPNFRRSQLVLFSHTLTLEHHLVFVSCRV